MGLGEQFTGILEAARTGADWAWDALYRELAQTIAGYLRSRGATEPEDLTGEVFLQIVRDLARFEGGEADFRSWVFVIAHRRLIDDRRHRSRRPEQPAEMGNGVPEVPGGDAETEALGRLGTAWAKQVISELSADQGDVLMLRIIGGLTVEEIARVIGKTPGSVKALQRRGLAAIKKKIPASPVSL